MEYPDPCSCTYLIHFFFKFYNLLTTCQTKGNDWEIVAKTGIPDINKVTLSSVTGKSEVSMQGPTFNFIYSFLSSSFLDYTSSFCEANDIHV